MDKDIRYTEKKIDESWKDQVDRDKGVFQAKQEAEANSQTPSETSKPFLQLLTSLAYQVMSLLQAAAQAEEAELQAQLQEAQNILDLLESMKEKTRNNLSEEEQGFFKTVLPELQQKLSQLC